MTDTPLWQLAATELAERIRKRDISCEQAVGACIERMHERNPSLNAVVEDLSEPAMEQARAHDRTLAANGPIGMLHGVPTTIKVNVDLEGHATTNGVAAFKDVIAPGDAPIVRNFIRSGAIVIGRTNTPEFSFRATTDNPLYGRTFNPWNDWASAGGSSGGAGSAVMMGFGPLAHGNDIGGSLRFPAACCGATTVKPGLGRVPAYNPSAKEERGPLAQIMSTQGVICRNVADVRLAMSSLIHYDPRDPWMVRAPFEGEPLTQPIKIAYTTEDYGLGIDPKVKAAVLKARDVLSEAGFLLEEVTTPSFEEIGNAGLRALFSEARVFMDKDVRAHGSETVQRIFDGYYDYFGALDVEGYVRAFADRNRYLRQWTTFLEDYPLVLTPFLLDETYAWDRDAQGPEGIYEVMGKSIYSGSMNFMGLPAATLPVDLNDGLPISVQIIGRRFREDMCLDAAEAIEQVAGAMAPHLWHQA